MKQTLRTAIMLYASWALCTPLSAAADEAAGTIPKLYQASPTAELKAGEWINSEPLPLPFSLPAAGTAIRFVYGSTDGVGGSKVLPTSGAIFLPAGSPPAGGWPVVAWAHGTVGIADRCAPSVNPRSGRDAEYLSDWLHQGFAIVATDYQGLGTPGPHPYLNTRAAAYSVLDAVRAAHAGVPDLANKVLLVGQSQGAGAAFATAGYAPHYAPDVNVIGTVVTGLPNIAASKSQASGDTVDRTIAYILYLAAAAQELDPSLNPSLGLQEAAMPALQAASQLCVGPMFEKVVQDKLTRDTTLKPGYREIYGKLLATMGYPTMALSHPVFSGIGERDIDTPTQGQLALIHAACDAGTKVEAHLYANLDHSGTVNPSFRDSSVFARKILAGEPIEARCNPAPQ